MDNRRQNASASITRQPYQSNIPSGNQQHQTATRTNRPESATRNKASTTHVPSTSTAPASSARSNSQEQSYSRLQPDANYIINPTHNNKNLNQSNTRQQQQYGGPALSTSREQMGIRTTNNVARNSAPDVKTKPTANVQEKKPDNSYIDSSSPVSRGQGDCEPYQNYQTSNFISKQTNMTGTSTKHRTLQPDGSNRTVNNVTRNIATTAPSIKSKTSTQAQEKKPDNSSMDSSVIIPFSSPKGEEYHCNVNRKHQYNPATTKQRNDSYIGNVRSNNSSVTAKSITQERNPSRTSSSSSQEITERSSDEYGSTLEQSGSNITSEATPSEQQGQFSPKQDISVEGSASLEWGSTSPWTPTPGQDNSYWRRECGGQSCSNPGCSCRSYTSPPPQRTNSNYVQQGQYPFPTQGDQNKNRCQTDYKYEDPAYNRSSKSSCNATQTETPYLQPRGQGRQIMTSPEKGKYFYENQPNRSNYEQSTCKPSTIYGPGNCNPSTSYEPCKCKPGDRSIAQSPNPWHSSPRRENYQPQPNANHVGIDRQYVAPVYDESPGNNFPQNEREHSNASPRPKKRKLNISPEAKPMEESMKPGKSGWRHFYDLCSSAVCSLFNTDEQSPSKSPQQVMPRRFTSREQMGIRSPSRNKLKRQRSDTSIEWTTDIDDTSNPTVIFINEATIYVHDTQSHVSESRSSSMNDEPRYKRKKRQQQSISQKRNNSNTKPNISIEESTSSEETQEDRTAFILADCARKICENKGCRDASNKGKKKK